MFNVGMVNVLKVSFISINSRTDDDDDDDDVGWLPSGASPLVVVPLGAVGDTVSAVTTAAAATTGGCATLALFVFIASNSDDDEVFGIDTRRNLFILGDLGELIVAAAAAADNTGLLSFLLLLLFLVLLPLLLSTPTLPSDLDFTRDAFRKNLLNVLLARDAPFLFGDDDGVVVEGDNVFS